MLIKRIAQLILLFILTVPATALAQGNENPSESYPITFERLTTDQGLAHDWIRGGIVQDPHGFVWIATNNGLSRFDGYQFKNFSLQSANLDSSGRVSVRAVDKDVNGILWLATDSGLTKFDPRTETAVRYQHSPADPTSLSDNDLREILASSDGFIWAGTAEGGLNRFDPATETFFHYQPDPTQPNSLGDIRVSALLEDSKGQLWVGTHRGGLQRFTPDAGFSAAYRHDPDDPSSISDNKVTTIFEDKDGILWVGTAAGLNRFDPASESFGLVTSNSDRSSALSDAEIQTVAQVETESGWLWVGTSKHGLYKFNPTAGMALHYEHDRLNLNSLSDNNVIAVFTDDSRVVWVATRNGLNKFSPFSLQFPYYTRLPDEDNTLSDDLVQAIYQDENGEVWLGTNAGGLNRIDPQTGRYTHYLHDPENANSPLSNDVEGIAPGAPGILWLGYATDGLSKFDIASSTFTHYVFDAANPESIPAGYIQDSLFYDAVGGELWLGLDGGGLVRFDEDSERFTAFSHEPDNPQSLSSNRIKHVYQDRGGAIWAGTVEAELNRLDPDTGTVTRFVYETDEVDARVAILYEAADGQMWVSAGSDLLKFDPVNGNFYSDNETAPWAGQDITTLSVDGHGNFWLGGRTDLNSYDPQTGSITHFDERDGLISCCGGWFLNRDTGQLFTSSPLERGFHSFNINQLQPRTYQPPVVLTEFYLFGQPVLIGGDSPLQQAAFAAGAMTLANSDNFAFEFAALDYANPDSIQYQYRLEGFEENWSIVGPQRRYAAYTSLPAGDYVFRVQATNSQDRWGDQEVALPVTIVPPWWQTRWFQAIVLALIVALAYGGYRWRMWEAERRNILLEEQVAERTLALADSEARFRGLSTSTFEAVIIHEQGRVLDANQAAVDTFGYSRAELIGRQAMDLTAPESRDLVARQIESGYEEVYELVGVTRDGRQIPLEARAKMVPYQGRQVRVVALRDLTERRQIETHKRQLAVMEERERIGRELHDDLGQVMSYVSVQSQAALARLESDDKELVRAILTRVTETARDAHADVRRHILDIRETSDAMEDSQISHDFTPVLTRYLTALEERYGLQTALSLPADWQDSLLAPEAEAQLLRIIQEALTNVRSHAGVSRARLLVTTHADEIQVVIEDDGVGFTLPPAPETADPDDGKRHFGLDIMRERAESAAGRLEVRSAPGEGTRIIVRMPRALEMPAETGGLEGIRVLIADDHPLYREGLRSLLSARGLHVVGEAEDGLIVQDMARELRPDLILMDVHMPGCDGVEATQRIKADREQTTIIMLTVADDGDLLFNALKSGASGYLLKSLDSRTFFDFLSQALDGQIVLSPSMAGRILSEFAEKGSSTAEIPAADQTLTTRQQEVLELVAQGNSNSEIATALVISEATVKYHVSQVLKRLQLRSRYQLAHYARQQDADAHRGGYTSLN